MITLILETLERTSRKFGAAFALRCGGAVWDARGPADLNNPTADDFWMMVPGPTQE